MKAKLTITAIFLSVAFFSFAQNPYLPLGSPAGNNMSGVNHINAMQLPRGTDTPFVAGVKGLLKDSVGMMFFRTDGTLWLRIVSTGTINKWVQIGTDNPSVIEIDTSFTFTAPSTTLELTIPHGQAAAPNNVNVLVDDQQGLGFEIAVDELYIYILYPVAPLGTFNYVITILPP